MDVDVDGSSAHVSRQIAPKKTNNTTPATLSAGCCSASALQAKAEAPPKQRTVVETLWDQVAGMCRRRDR